MFESTSSKYTITIKPSEQLPFDFIEAVSDAGKNLRMNVYIHDPDHFDDAFAFDIIHAKNDANIEVFLTEVAMAAFASMLIEVWEKVR